MFLGGEDFAAERTKAPALSYEVLRLNSGGVSSTRVRRPLALDQRIITLRVFALELDALFPAQTGCTPFASRGRSN